jgi:2-C-methyl-D-erythritol 4-phosphate cytidylyltransferase
MRTSGYGLVTAAGEGSRFGGRKQFALLAGKPLLFYSLQAFERCPQVRETVVVTNADMIDRVEALTRRWRLRKVNWVVAGGEQRQDSVRQGLRVLPDSGMVAIHDGARPFLDARHLTQGFTACRRQPAVIYAFGIAETVKQLTRGCIERTIPRHELVLAQTPQFFDLALVKRAHRQAEAEGFYGTDDAQLVERLGRRVAVLPGWPENVKITTASDLARAEQAVKLFARDKRRRGQVR